MAWSTGNGVISLYHSMSQWHLKQPLPVNAWPNKKGSKGFWAFTEYWFTHTAGNGQGLASYDEIPALFGLDKTKYAACLTDPTIIKKIKDDIQAGNAASVTGTPATLIIDNQTGKTETLVGAQPFDRFVQVIEGMANPEKAKAEQPVPPAKK